jgi:hypothetical protein
VYFFFDRIYQNKWKIGVDVLGNYHYNLPETVSNMELPIIQQVNSTQQFISLNFGCQSNQTVIKIHKEYTMKKRIARRFVLGTVLGGLVASPFLMHFFRRGKTIPKGNVYRLWEETWSDWLRKMEPTIRPSNIPPVFKCSFVPISGTKRKMSILFSGDNSFDEASSNQIPEYYGIVNYDVNVKKFDKDIVISGTLVKNDIFSPVQVGDADMGDYRNHWDFGVKNGRLTFVKIRNGEVIPVSDLEDEVIKVRYLDFQPVIGIDAPSSSFSVGSTFQANIPSPEGIYCPVMRKITNVVLVDNSHAVKVETDAVMKSEDIIRYFSLLSDQLTDTKEQSLIRSEIKELQNTGVSTSFHVESYYQLENGMLIFYKMHRTTYIMKPVVTQKHDVVFIKVS